MLDDLVLPGELRLRPAQPEDEPFRKHLFRSTRPHLELIGMPDAVVDALIAQQYQLQQNHYATQWPTASRSIILLAGKAVGGIIIDQGNGALHIIDLALVSEHRGKGFGTALLRAVQNMADKRRASLMLSVDRQNTLARKLYLSLGFTVTKSSETHETMIWTPGSTLEAPSRSSDF